MNAGADLFSDLPAQLWHGPLTAPEAPQSALEQALGEGAPYGFCLAGLRMLWQLALPGDKAARIAAARWPNSIDFAVLAVDLSAPDARPERLAALRDCVLQANRRRAALANACLRYDQIDLAREALAQIDPASETAADDLYRRAELALGFGAFDAMRADIATLEERGTQGTEALRLKLAYAAEGASALARRFEGLADPEPYSCAVMFELALRDGDYQRAPEALARWRSVAPQDDPALARAHARLALEQGDAEGAMASLRARLDAQTPWHWEAVDHVLWLRTSQALHDDPALIWAHAEAAQRLAPRHDWLAHVARFAQEAACDWQALAVSSPSPAAFERRMIAAQSAQRMGLPARALALIAAAQRDARQGSLGGQASRLEALRAEIFWTAGRLSAAAKAQARAAELAHDLPRQAECAVLGAEIALSRCAPDASLQALRIVAERFPRRMVLPLTEARCAFQRGDFILAQHAHARFNALKAKQIGAFSPSDVRDRICDDAARCARGVQSAFSPRVPIEDLLARVGLAQLAASPGLSAYLMTRALHAGALGFTPTQGAAIPRKIAHYWQGPQGPAVGRALAAWRAHHPDHEQHLFDAKRAEHWLSRRYPPAMAARFRALDHPALQADLFRLCWIVREGGVFIDLDEFPRMPVTSWLEGAQAVFCIERGFGTIANNFIAAIPRHPICIDALDRVCAELDRTDAPYAWWHSGPAQWTCAVVAAHFSGKAPHVRYLSQAEYNRRIATNLPYPHKRGPDHWR